MQVEKKSQSLQKKILESRKEYHISSNKSRLLQNPAFRCGVYYKMANEIKQPTDVLETSKQRLRDKCFNERYK